MHEKLKDSSRLPLFIYNCQPCESLREGARHERRWSHAGAGESQERILRPLCAALCRIGQQGSLLHVFCVALVVTWATTFLFTDFDTWQLLINTPMTIITFLLVAFLQNTQRRGEQAIHIKLDAIADGMADLMRHFADDSNELR